MKKILNVYLHDELVGRLLQENNELSFEYDEVFLNSKPSMAISISMPLNSKAYSGNVVQAFFAGLLPDDVARHKLARFLGISEKNSFALLHSIGGECAGALSLHPENSSPTSPNSKDIEILTDSRLDTVLSLLRQRPLLAGTDNLRLSLAGAQDKIAVKLIDDQIALVGGTNPTTHILKPAIADINDSVYNEFFCMRLARLINIDTPHVKIRKCGNSTYFLIERYDRLKVEDKIVQRIHQEDFCQALGKHPNLKYENEGGPSISQCIQILQNHSLNPANDILEFIRRIIFNFIIGNADAHAKNYSLLYKSHIPSLAPAYDILCTKIYPEFTSKMAMKIGGKYDPDFIVARHWLRIVPDTKFASKNLENSIIGLATNCVTSAKTLIQTLKQENIVSPIYEQIYSVIKSRSDKLILNFK